MSDYRIDEAGGRIERLRDGASFPNDDRAPEYPEYLDWLRAGGAPEILRSPPPPQPVAIAEFRARFSRSEIEAILTLAYSGSGDAPAAMLLLKLQTSSEIDVRGPEVKAGLDYLVARGALAASRAAEIIG